MKKICLWLLILLWPCMALAAHTYPTKEERRALAELNITEVYGWNSSDVNRFAFEEVETGDLYTVRYWPEDHPTWVYEQSFNKADFTTNPAPGGSTPFHTGYENYPGENSVRGVLELARRNQWFTQWNTPNREAFAKAINDWGITLTAAGYECLANETSTAAEIIQHYFESCYGEESLWPEALKEWRDEVLSENHLQPAVINEAKEGIVEYDMPSSHCVRFYGEAPKELENLMDGWDCLSGFLSIYKSRSTGAVVLGKGEERLLVALLNEDDKGWTVQSILNDVLLPGETPIVRRGYELEYPKLGLRVEANFTGTFWQVQTLESVQNGNGFRYANDTLTFFENGELSAKEADATYPQQYLDYLHLNEILTRGHVALQPALYEPSRQIIVTGNVHLRKETSSHSKDLGMFSSETLGEILGTEPGDPDLWYHVRIGYLEGYMSSHYAMPMTDKGSATPLSVGYAKESADLREDTGWFNVTLRKVNQGETMHILAERGSWYYVCIPMDGHAGRWMDMDGEYGFIRQDKLDVGATEQQLLWKHK